MMVLGRVSRYFLMDGVFSTVLSKRLKCGTSVSKSGFMSKAMLNMLKYSRSAQVNCN